jgi:energy-coupling factor transporter ATP-binding protein EcfA2
VFVERVRIKNVRGFREVDLDLTRPEGEASGWTVLAGRNGSGKSTLLQAIALTVSGPATARSLKESFAGWVREGQTEAEVEVGLSPSQYSDAIAPPPRGEAYVVISHETSLLVGLRWTAAAENHEPELTISRPGDWRSQAGGGPWDENTSGWFVAGYGPTRRLTGHGAAAQRLMSGPARIARLVSLFREDASLLECVEWLRDIYLRRLEGKRGAAELEQQVLRLLNDGLLPGQTRVQRIDSEGLWVSQEGVLLPLEELSDGYRTTAALVMDIVRHLHLCYGDLRLEEGRGPDEPGCRVMDQGVVLIDEIDLHLHVSWQQRIGFWLKTHFPNIQFLVATHSPFICQAADPGGLIRLPAPGEERPVEHVPEDVYHTVVNGTVDDAVLTELFGLESPHSDAAEALRSRVAELEAQLQTSDVTAEERDELAALRQRLPQSMAGDVEQELRRLIEL